MKRVIVCWVILRLKKSKTALVQNNEDKPVAVIGLNNVVVINTPEGILVARKDLSQKVGEISKRINSEKGNSI